MESMQLQLWRRALDLLQEEAALVIGVSPDTYRKWELYVDKTDWEPGLIIKRSVANEAPAWMEYVVGWTMIFGLGSVYGAEEMADKLVEFRERFNLTRGDLAKLFELSRGTIRKIENKKGSKDAGPWMEFATNWCSIYGSRLPLSGHQRSPVILGLMARSPLDEAKAA
jgi:DNA-binding XRE family transcriptional regulator